jgi:hypothetical protein
MAKPPSPNFDAPIPGQSLTAKLGSRPWQQKSKLTTVQESMDYYIPKLTNTQSLPKLLNIIEQGVPLVVIADSMQTISVMEGVHTIDIGILTIPVMVEMMMYLAEEAEVKYVIGTESSKDKDKIDPTVIALALKTIKKESPKQIEETVQDVEPLLDETASEPPAGGLMSRRA